MAELSQKLQEIEVGQPADATKHRVSLTTYNTFLKGLSVSRGTRCGQEQASTKTSWVERLVYRLA